MLESGVRQSGSSTNGDLSDRCPYPRPFGKDGPRCPPYQPARFLPVDSTNNPLTEATTCRHLTVGIDRAQAGRFYPRCALGTREDRLKWLNGVGAERLQLIRRLQEDFDEFSRPYRRRLLEARRSQAQGRPSSETVSLEQAVEDFIAACKVYVSTHRKRFEDAGFAVEALMRLITDWWKALLPPSESAGHAAVAAAHPAIGTFIVADPLPAGADADGGAIVYSDAALQILFQPDRPGLALAGQVDARNVEAVARTLANHVNGDAEFHLDLRGLEFCDVGGLSAIVRTAGGLGAGRSLVLHSMPDHLRLAVELVGWGRDEVPALVLAEEGA